MRSKTRGEPGTRYEQRQYSSIEVSRRSQPPPPSRPDDREHIGRDARTYVRHHYATPMAMRRRSGSGLRRRSLITGFRW